MNGATQKKSDFLTKRQRYDVMRAELKNERATFEPVWQECAEFVLPQRARFQLTDTNRGDRRNRSIYDITATLAHGTLQSGMMSGITSPARPWFRLATPDPEMNEFGAVKDWTDTVRQRMNAVFSRSNLYRTLSMAYGDIGAFGTAAILMEEDFARTVRFTAFPIGSYCLASDENGRNNVFFREFRMTVRNLVEKFGRRTASGGWDWSNISVHVRNLFDKGNYETWVDVSHLVAPNPDWDPADKRSASKRFASCYWEAGGQGNDKATTGFFLRESGYDFFPVLGPRWSVGAEEAYATSWPALVALGDVRQLQLGEKRALQGIEKMVNPPMQAPTSLRKVKASILPGDVTYYDTPAGREGLRPVHEVQPRIQELEIKQAQVRERIQRAFYEDLFLMLARSDRREITAREIEERHEEKLLVLGPVLENLNWDLLDPLVENTFNIMLEQGLIPPPPEELQGQDLRVEYISVMAQAQKLVAIGGIERSAQFAMNVASVNPEILDKYDWDQMGEEHGDAVGLSPKILRTKEEVEKLRAGRRQAAQAQQASEMAAQGAQTVKALSESRLDSDTALSRVLDYAQAGQAVPQ